MTSRYKFKDNFYVSVINTEHARKNNNKHILVNRKVHEDVAMYIYQLEACIKYSSRSKLREIDVYKLRLKTHNYPKYEDFSGYTYQINFNKQ